MKESIEPIFSNLLRMRARSPLACCALCIMGFVVLETAICAKLPSWRGPNTFFDGTIPTNRNGHGFASCDGRMYVFGGEVGKQGASEIQSG
jgi:hypothetical protein